MKIAVWHNLSSGGAKRALYYQVKGLVERGHTLECWSPSTADPTYLPLSEFITEHVLPLKLPSAKPAKSRLGNARSLLDSTHAQLNALDAHCREVGKQINAGGFDLLLCGPDMYYSAPPLGRYVKGIPRVLYLQDPARVLYEAMPRLPWPAIHNAPKFWWGPLYIKLFFRYWYTRLVDIVETQSYRIRCRDEQDKARAFDTILVNSFYSREAILRAYGIDTKVCYLGIDTEQFKPTGAARRGHIIGVGSLSPHKNIDLVIKAVGKVRGERPPLVWIGNLSYPPYVDELKKLAADNGVDFRPMQMIPDHELLDLLSSASMMVYAPRLEPFGYAPIEANACGLPVVGVAEGGVRETVVDGVNGLLVEHDPADIARAIERLLGDPGLARRLADNGRRIAQEKWSLAAATDRLEHRLLEALGRLPANATNPHPTAASPVTAARQPAAVL